MSCGVGCRRGSDPPLLWLWCRPAATAPIRPLAWELSCAMGAALEETKRPKQKKKEKKNILVALRAQPRLEVISLRLHKILKSIIFSQEVFTVQDTGINRSI